MSVINFKDLIDFDLLSFYDSKIKDYISKSKQIIFTSTEEIPDEGKTNILYVTKDSLYLWDEENNKYIIINSSSSNDGIYFIPSIDENGNLSWSNNGELQNPDTVNVAGPAGTSVINVAVDENNNLICLLSNGSIINAGEISNSIVFVNNIDDLPAQGQNSILYIVGKNIYVWDGEKYISISTSGESGDLQWETF